MNDSRTNDLKILESLARLDERTKSTHETVGKMDDRFERLETEMDRKHDNLEGRVRKNEGSIRWWSGAAAVTGIAVGWVSRNLDKL